MSDPDMIQRLQYLIDNFQNRDSQALEWAIDQLRWRRVEEGLPTEDGTYQVATEGPTGRYPEHAEWCFGNKWDGIPWDKTYIKWWRPVTMPETE